MKILIYFCIILITTCIVIKLIGEEKFKKLFYKSKQKEEETPKNTPIINTENTIKLETDIQVLEAFFDTAEENKSIRLDEIIHLWRRTNFWLGCIGLFFLVVLICLFITVIISAQLGIKIIDILQSI